MGEYFVFSFLFSSFSFLFRSWFWFYLYRGIFIGLDWGLIFNMFRRRGCGFRSVKIEDLLFEGGFGFRV